MSSKNIAIILKGRRNFGHITCYLPLILKLKEDNPGCKITIFGQFPLGNILCLDGCADKFYNYKELNFFKLFKLLTSDFDEIINFSYSSLRFNWCIFPFSKAKVKRVININNYDNTYFAYKYLHSCGYFDESTSILSRLSSGKFNKDYLTILPGGGSGDFKCWDINNFIQTADLLVNDDFDEVIFVLGNNEKELQDVIPKSIGGKPVTIAFNYSIPDLISIAESTKLAISNDCGPSHIFQMLHKNIVVLFGWENKERSPYSVINNWFLTRENAFFIVPPYYSDKINDIKVDQVLKLSKLLFLNATNGECDADFRNI